MNDPTIRRATSADAALLAEIGARTFVDAFGAVNTPEDMDTYVSHAFTTERLASELADPSNVFFVAEVEGVVAGYAKLRAGTPSPHVTGPDPIEISRIYVDQSVIGRGIGAALMHACFDEARARGRRTIWLGVWEQNERAKDFYARWGFRRVGQQAFVLGSDRQIDWVMAAEL